MYCLKVTVLMMLFIFIRDPTVQAKNLDLSAEHAKQVEDTLNQIPAAEKMEHVLNRFLVNGIGEGIAQKEFEQRHKLDLKNNQIRVVVELKDPDPDLSFLKSYGAQVEAAWKDRVQVMAPVEKLAVLAGDKNVNYVRRPFRAYHGGLSYGGGGGAGGSASQYISEGVARINGDQLHAAGINGRGVKVAVIDSAFNGYRTNPELPPDRIVAVKSFRLDGKMEDQEDQGGDHGTACAEIVLDVAPEADLILLACQTGVEFVEAVDYAVNHGVEVISHSAGFLVGPFDGSGFICDVVDEARQKGVLFVNSAGNYAMGHYEGWFNNPDNDHWHNFTEKDETLDLGYLPAGYPVDLLLSWNDWPVSGQDFDLVLLRETYDGVELVDYSLNTQNGSQPPYEIINYLTKKAARYLVAIYKESANRSVHFELYAPTLTLQEYNHPESSLGIPADAAGTLAVGAAYWQNDALEVFSSRGPTNDGRIKPDMVAPDGVSTRSYGIGKFFGTSAAAPHAAGAAVLVKSMHPGLTAEELQKRLEEDAVDLGAPGKDNQYGSGRVDLGGEIPAGAGISGIVRLEKVRPADPEPDSPAADHSGTEISISQQDKQVKNGFTEKNGSYHLDGLNAGTYSLDFIRPGWTRVEKDDLVLTANSTLDLPAITLYVGDMNQDTQINILDLLWMVPGIGLSPEKPGWPEHQLADVNKDYSINILDLLRVAKNIGKKP